MRKKLVNVWQKAESLGIYAELHECCIVIGNRTFYRANDAAKYLRRLIRELEAIRSRKKGVGYFA